jgi:hypothetical protein
MRVAIARHRNSRTPCGLPSRNLRGKWPSSGKWISLTQDATAFAHRRPTIVISLVFLARPNLLRVRSARVNFRAIRVNFVYHAPG